MKGGVELDIRKLATFVDLAATLNFSETAENLFLSQATVSKQIGSLEKELQVQLFDRTHRRVQLTAAGQAILSEAEAIVNADRQLHQILRESGQDQNKVLNLKAIPSIQNYKAFNLLAAFTKQHPEIQLRFSEAEGDDLLPALDDNTADIAFLRVMDKNNPNYQCIEGEVDHFVALLPKDHPLTKMTDVSLAALHNEHFLLPDERTGLYQPVLELAKAANFVPNVVYKGRRLDLILGMVARHMGVSIAMSQSVDLTDYPAVVERPLLPETLSYLVFVRPLKVHSAASDLFWAYCRAHT